MAGVGAGLIAPAKINLALHVTGRRADGYHLLDSIAVFAEIGDRVEIAPAKEPGVSVSGRFAAHAPGDRTDLAWRAAEAFFVKTGLKPPLAVRVEKSIPAGAGLGGGSADAAATLVALNRFLGAGIPASALSAIGLTLGADVPMCLIGKTLRARGVGEEIELLEGWPPLPLVLVWPGRAVSTAEVFRALEHRENPPLPPPPSAAALPDIAAWLAGCRNDLEGPARAIAPEIGEALALIGGTGGCLLARMSGSGSACFGLYSTPAEAAAATALLRKRKSAWWVEATLAR